MTETRDVLVKRLRYHSYKRGCKECDILFSSFADCYLENFSDAALQEYDTLLQELDADILDWVMEKRPCPDDLNTPLMQQFLEHARNIKG